MNMEDLLDLQELEKAKSFWSQEDADRVFGVLFEFMDHLKKVVKSNTATDREYIQALRLVEILNFACPASQDSSVVQVVVGSELLPSELSPHNQPSPCSSLPSSIDEAIAPSGREDSLTPLALDQLDYKPHSCSKVCLGHLPRMHQSTHAFWGLNPLKVPLLCGFKRLSSMPLSPKLGDGDNLDGDEDWDVVYRGPCGQTLSSYEDIMRFLLATESYDILHVDFFTFNPYVHLDPCSPPGIRHSELDLSRGAEPTPVELCLGERGVRPPAFRYRKDRWPHGCFLTRDPALFRACCDCPDGCSRAERCVCVAMMAGGQGYRYQRLKDPVASGLYECGPWCDCDRSRCQNRLVQRGIRVRLQVFQTKDRGWGVRCRDDLDRGTFLCIYAGLVLQRAPSPTDLPPPKLSRVDFPSDDEVEVVTEWLAPPILEAGSETGSSPDTPPTSLQVPVIQKPMENIFAPPELEMVPVVTTRHSSSSSTPADPPTGEKDSAPSGSVNGHRQSLKRAAAMEDVTFVDASREGNVSRFFNHSCKPNMFIQNVFTDSHDPNFPIVAFFTSRVVKAGTELTWNYAADEDVLEQSPELPCLCQSDDCRGRFHLEEPLCDACEAEDPSLDSLHI